MVLKYLIQDVEYISKFLTPEQNNLLKSQTKNTRRNRILRDLIDHYKMQNKTIDFLSIIFKKKLKYLFKYFKIFLF